MFAKKFKHIFFFDFETTGLDPMFNDPIQLAYSIETDGKEVINRDLKMKPYYAYKCDSCKKLIKFNGVSAEYDECPHCKKGDAVRNVSPEAMKIIGKTFKEIMEYPDPLMAVNIMLQDFKNTCTGFNERLLCAGYNIKSFDMPFMDKWLYKVTGGKTKFYKVFMHSPYLDVLPIAIGMYYRVAMRNPEKLPTDIKNIKLASAVSLAKQLVPKYFEGKENESENFHDALYDVQQTKDVCKALLGI